MGGIIRNPKGNLVTSYAWGLGNVSNNTVEAYVLWEDIEIAREMRIHKLVIFGNSMLVIRAIIKRSIVENNVFIGIIPRSLALLAEFEEVAIYHIKHEHNSCVDY